LTSLTECGLDSAGQALACYAPTRFTWNALEGDAFPEGFPGALGSTTIFSSTLRWAVDLRVGDVDGDGRQDLVYLRDRTCDPFDQPSGPNVRFRMTIARGNGVNQALDAPISTDVLIPAPPAPAGYSLPSCASIGVPGTQFVNDTQGTTLDVRWDTLWHMYDFSGDGRDDLLLQTIVGFAGLVPQWGWRVHPAVASGGSITFASTGLDVGIGPSEIEASRLADFDGDGLPDIWYYGKRTPESELGFQVRYLRRDTAVVGLAFRFEPAARTVAFANLSFYVDAFSLAASARTLPQSADINGDGRSDIVVAVSECPEPNGSPPQVGYRVIPAWTYKDGVPVATVAGRDARAPNGSNCLNYSVVVVAAEQTSTTITFRGLSCVGLPGAANPNRVLCQNDPLADASIVDLNGDAVADLLLRRGTSQQTISYRIGTGGPRPDAFEAEENTGLSLERRLATATQLIDINGDKRLDLLFRRDCRFGCPGGLPLGYPMRVLLLGANGYGSEMNPLPPAARDLIAAQGDEGFITIPIDYNGDGATDLFRYQTDGTVTNNAWAAPSSLRYGGADQIVRIVNGFGARHDIAYASLTNASAYTRAFDGPQLQYGRGSPVFDVFSALWVVREVQSSAPTPVTCDAGDPVCVPGNTGPNAVARIRYSYGGARVQSGGRGFLGFAWMRTEDLQNLLVTTTHNQQSFPFIGRPLETHVERAAFLAPDLCDNESGEACFTPVPENCRGPDCDLGASAITPAAPKLLPPMPAQTAGTLCLPTAPSATGPTSAQLLTESCSTWASEPPFVAATAQPLAVFAAAGEERKYDPSSAGSVTQRAVTHSVDIDRWGNPLLSVQDTRAADGTLIESLANVNFYGCTQVPVQVIKGVGCAGPSEPESQRLGRLSLTGAASARPPSTVYRVRRSAFEYDVTTRQLIAEVTGLFVPGEVSADEIKSTHRRVDHVRDPDGNVTLSVTCSAAHYPNRSACLDLAAFQQRQWPADPTRVQRYVRTEYELDPFRRFVTGTRLPYYSAAASGGNDEAYGDRVGVTQGQLSRNAFGDPLTSVSVHGVVSEYRYGALGRLYFMRTATGAFERTRYAWCQDAGVQGTGLELAAPPAAVPRVNCPVGAVYRVERRSEASVGAMAGQHVAPHAFAYFDSLGREMLATTRVYQSAEADPGMVSRWSSTETRYDILGRARATSVPYFSVDPDGPQFTARAGSPRNAVERVFQRTRFDAIGRGERTEAPAEAAVGGTYTAEQTYAGLATSAKNARANTITSLTNPLSETVRVTDEAQFVVEQTYVEFGLLSKVSRCPAPCSNPTADRIETTISYDTFGRKQTLVDPDSGTSQYRYNIMGEVIVQTDAKGQIQSLFYDAQGRVWQRTETRRTATGSQVPESTSTWTFDDAMLGGGSTRARGLLVRESNDATGIAAFDRVTRYDAFGRPQRVETTIDGTVYHQRQTYDAFGRPWQSFDASADANSALGTLTDYSTDGYPIRIREAANGLFGQIYQELLAVSARLQVRRERYHGANALTTVRDFDHNTGRLLGVFAGSISGGVSDGAIQHWGYAWDANGNLGRRTQRAGLPGAQFDLEEQFDYDPRDRLTGVRLTRFEGIAQNTPTLGMDYDDLGNIRSVTRSATRFYSYKTLPIGCAQQAGPHAVSQMGDKSYCHDANGNQTETRRGGQVVRSIVWTGYNLPEQITRNENTASGPINATVSFRYAPDRSVFLRVDGGVGDAPRTCPDANPDRIFCAGFETGDVVPTAPVGTVTRTIGNVEVSTQAGITTTKRYIGGFLVITTTSLNSITSYRYLFRDALGSLDAIATETGMVVERLSFDAWGNRRHASPPGAANLWSNFDPLAAANATATNPVTRKGYTGHEQVDAVGLIHMGGRIYDPELGRFIQADPLTDAHPTQGLNRYSYVLNNPLTRTDPTGYLSVRQVLGIAIGVAFAFITHGLWVQNFLVEAFATAAVGGFVSGIIATGNLRASLWGAVSAVVFLGIGTGFSHTTSQVVNGVSTTVREATGSTIARIAAHAGAGGALAELQGGNFGHGFLSAGVTKALSPAIGQIGMADGHASFTDVLVQTMAAAAVGGSVSRLTGGSFANGAATAAFQHLFNQVATQSNQSLISVSNMGSAQAALRQHAVPWEQCQAPLLCAAPLVPPEHEPGLVSVAPELFFVGPVRAVAAALWRDVTFSQTRALQAHLDAAVARFAEQGFTLSQARAIARNPSLEPAFRGERIDTFFRQSFARNPVPGIVLTPRGQFGPDAYSVTRSMWWDVTRSTQWSAHVIKYNPSFGYGVLLRY
jgi:RHS repeat-associated protein